MRAWLFYQTLYTWTASQALSFIQWLIALVKLSILIAVGMGIFYVGVNLYIYALQFLIHGNLSPHWLR